MLNQKGSYAPKMQSESWLLTSYLMRSPHSQLILMKITKELLYITILFKIVLLLECSTFGEVTESNRVLLKLSH